MGDDELIASKAMERKARLAEMIGNNNAATEETTSRVGAHAVMKGDRNDDTSNQKMGPPTALARLDEKIGAQQRLTGGATATVRTMKASLVTQMQGDHSSSETNGNGTTGGSSMEQALRATEANALLKQNLPSARGEHPPQASGESLQDVETASAVTAQVVNEARERQMIEQKAQAELISNTVVATAIDEEKEKRNRRCQWCCLLACLLLLLVLAAAIVGGVCGAGKCSSSDTRSRDIVKLVNSVSIYANETNGSIPYPPTDSDTPEEQSLQFLIENDALNIPVLSDGAPEPNWRLIQRYALLVLWFNNGPWVETDSPIGGDDVSLSTNSAWLAQPDECGWSGVECDAEGRAIALNLAQRGLSGTIPKDLGLLVDCVDVSFRFNILGGMISDALSVFDPLVSLASLDLGFNKFEGSIPSTLAQWPWLRDLDLGYNRLTGSLPDSMWGLTNLQGLVVSSNTGLNETIPSYLGDLTSLTKLDVSGSFSGDFPYEVLDRLQNLEYLGLSQAQSFTALSGLSKLTHLATFSASMVEGSIPAEVVTWWPNMEVFQVSTSNLTGTIPSSLSKWSRLTGFLAGFNSFTGTLPGELFEGWSESLKEFGVARTGLRGTIPTEIGLCGNLTFLNLQQNNFRGTIPTTVGMLTKMKSFYVNSNQLSGTIPNAVLNFDASFVKLESNNFNGVAPYCDPSYDMGDLRVSVDCDKVQCPCCVDC